MKHTQKGFTLVELLVVIAILAILATVSVVGYTSYISKANDSVAMQEAQPFETMIKSEIAVNGYCKIAVVTTGEGETAATTTYFAVDKKNHTAASTNQKSEIVLVSVPNDLDEPNKTSGKYSDAIFTTSVPTLTLDKGLLGSDVPAGAFKIDGGKIVYTGTKGGTYTLFSNK